jgi:hypothetical protein
MCDRMILGSDYATTTSHSGYRYKSLLGTTATVHPISTYLYHSICKALSVLVPVGIAPMCYAYKQPW